MLINIPTKADLIFNQYLTIMNTLLSKDKKLTNIEIEVLAKMLYINYLYKSLEKDKRDIIIFHKETKLKIRQSLYNMSVNSFKNILVKLRKKGFIDYNKLKITVPLENDTIDLQFKLKINASEN